MMFAGEGARHESRHRDCLIEFLLTRNTPRRGKCDPGQVASERDATGGKQYRGPPVRHRTGKDMVASMPIEP